MTLPLTHDDGQIAYGFFSRKGGSSSGVFSSLNCKPGAGDNDNAVSSNRRQIADRLHVAPSHLATLTQIHSAICHTISEPLAAETEGDALVTSTPGLAIGVLTADCAPVLFVGSKPDGSPVVGAAHAGWGGAVKGVLESTIDAMQAEGANVPRIKAMVGPCIAKLSYEVSADFLAPFLADDPVSEKFFMPLANDKFLFDLPAYVKFRLNRAGVQDIQIGGQDTYADEDNWFSFRRATHRDEKEYGRQISAICIRKDAP